MQCKAKTKSGNQCKRNATDNSQYCYQHKPTAKDIESLNSKQIRFCEEYILDNNGAAAARRAGYSEDTARVIASELLSKPNINAYIEKLRHDRSLRTQIDADMVIKEIAKVAFVDITDFFDIQKADVIKSEAAGLIRIKGTDQQLILKNLNELKDKTPGIKSIKIKDGEVEIQAHNKSKMLDKLLDHVAINKEAYEKLQIEKEKIKLQRERIALQRKQLELQEEKAGLGEAKGDTGVIIIPEATEGEE